MHGAAGDVDGVSNAPVGLSIGATNLTAVAVGRTSLTRPAQVGVPGRELTDFVDRVGDPVAILAPDGSSHRPETLLVEALRAMLPGVGGASQLGVTHPVHWRPAAIDALRAALATAPELAGAALVDDASAAATALADHPGLPTRGAIAVCDFGGSGTSITFVDAANGYRPIGPVVRHLELSGAMVDQALLRRVLADLPDSATGAAGTSALGSLSRLRDQCRAAKERLSDVVATALQVDLPTHRAEVRLTRDELDAQLRAPLAEFVLVLRDAMQRNAIRPGDLAAVASAGGGARIPVITTTLSEHLGIPVITAPYPALSAAIGGGLTAVARAGGDAVTAVATAAPVLAAPAVPASSPPQLAWSQDTGAIAEPVPYAGPVHDPRPEVRFSADDASESVAAVFVPWYRRPHVLLGLGAAVVLAAAVTAVVLLQHADDTPAPNLDSTSTTAVPASPETSAPAPAPQTPAQTGTVAPPPPATQAPQPASEAPPPATQAPEPASEAPAPSSTEAPPPPTQTQTPPPAIPTIPTIPPIPTIPGLPPFIPQPGQLVSP